MSLILASATEVANRMLGIYTSVSTNQHLVFEGCGEIYTEHLSFIPSKFTNVLKPKSEINV